ncbi:19489_t:CDS:1, partial [Gigaspora margarita]
ILLNSNFQNWFSTNDKIASIFTLIASANVEILNILDSNFAGFKCFFAELSNNTKKWVFYSSIINMFIEDILSLIIQ